MKYFLDTEFIERPNEIELISVGIYCLDDDSTFYAESTNFNEDKADDWVKENVLSNLKFYNKGAMPFNSSKTKSSLTDNKTKTEVFGNNLFIKEELLKYIGEDKNPEFYAYYADYDWVVFCWLFGKMIDLPENFPMYCRDIKQMMDERDLDDTMKPEQNGTEHNALDDAIYDAELYEWVITQD